MAEVNGFSSYTYGEGKTHNGQLVAFTCRYGAEQVQMVKDFLCTHVRSIDLPLTKRVNVAHGGYGQYTRYNVTQHKYAGGGPGDGGGWGYIEVLEIAAPPEDRCPVVINECTSIKGSAFTEWATIEQACAAFEKHWGSHNTQEHFPSLPGFKRFVRCGLLTPWFYAIGDEVLIGDYAFPDGFQDDPVYRAGQKFVVYDENGLPAVKICMGARFCTAKAEPYSRQEQQYRIVYWNDGSTWTDYVGSSFSRHTAKPPRLLREDELWIGEAMEQFQKILAGQCTHFDINFTDGSKFIGKVIQTTSRSPCAAGRYYVKVTVKGIEKVFEGWVNDFEPTPEYPDIVQYVTKRYAKEGKIVECVVVVESEVEKDGKKWAGVFFKPSPSVEVAASS